MLWVWDKLGEEQVMGLMLDVVGAVELLAVAVGATVGGAWTMPAAVPVAEIVSVVDKSITRVPVILLAFGAGAG